MTNQKDSEKSNRAGKNFGGANKPLSDVVEPGVPDPADRDTGRGNFELGGESTATGVTQDLTTGRAGGGRFGGPTGGDFSGGGGGGLPSLNKLPDYAEGGEIRTVEAIREEDTGMAEKALAQNTRELINEEARQGKIH